MGRIMLRVPIFEKEEAKRLGARWDARERSWYIPERVNSAPLQKWIPEPQSPNVRAPYYYIASTKRECWSCERETSVHGIILPEEHETLWVDDDPSKDEWQVAGVRATLSYIADMPESISMRLRELAPLYKVDYSQTTHGFYWMNHCEHCAAKLGDFETFCEPGVAFYPANAAQAAAIRRHEIRESFAASCGTIRHWIEDDAG
jgi:hypothetical protein